MGWQIQWDHKPWETVDGNTLRQYANSGTLSRDTKVKSISKNFVASAGDIAGLFPTPSEVAEQIWNPPPMQEPEWIRDYAAKSVPKRPRPGLFDVRFDSFVTVDLVSLIWQLAIWFLAFSSLLQLYLVMRYIPMAEQWWIKVLQVGFAVFVTISVTACLGLAVRVVLEAIVVLFKIEEHLRKR